MKRIFLIIFFLILLIGAFVYYFNRNERSDKRFIKVSGNIEATEVDVGFKIPGRITELNVQEGDWVKKERVLARLDDQDLRDRMALAEATLRAAQARLSKLRAGSRPEEIREAEAVVSQTQYDLQNKELIYERMKILFERRVIPKETLDNAEAGFKIALASFKRAQENYQLVKEGPRKEDIEEATAQMEQAKASLKLTETQLGYSTLRAPLPGVVLVKSGEVGEVVNPGTPILTIADIQNVWLKAYIPEPDLGSVAWGQEVTVTTDIRPQKEYRGSISFISSEAEFTPKSIQTEKERVTLVYRIKIDLPNPDRELKPGMPADGKIFLEKVQGSKVQEVK